MKIVYACLIIFGIFLSSFSFSQTSWKGTINTSWGTSTNWTNGLPSSTNAATIGDASFTGSLQPTISSAYTLKSINIGGTVVSVLTISKAVTINEDVTINANGTLSQGNISITVKGNWNNAGNYILTSNTKCIVNFGGSTQSIGGTSTTTFHKSTINTGTVVTLNRNLVVNNLFTIKGTFDPSTFTASGAAGITVDNGGLMRVNTTLFTDNYNFSGTKTAIGGSIVEYLKAGDQTISSLFTYSTLKISGSGIKSLVANLSDLKNTGATYGNIQVTGGTFDMAGLTANRTGGGTVGGTFSLANTTTLKLSGASNFPANYNSYSLAPIVR